jgi:predicted phage baseplate assembly protein
LPAVQAQISLRNPVPASGGAEAETLDHCMGRAIEFLGKPQRAVTLADCETLAKETPGVDIARATAWANLHPSFPCLKAPGMITVVVLPNMPVARPTPSPALLSSVATYVNARRIIGSRIEVVGPTYREVAVRAQVQSVPGTAKPLLAQKVADALNAFLNPLSGGPDGTGWPFGRDIYRVEILQVIDHVPGVDYVASLALLADGCECTPQCGNVCLAPTWLVSSGQHEIEVL